MKESKNPYRTFRYEKGHRMKRVVKERFKRKEILAERIDKARKGLGIRRLWKKEQEVNRCIITGKSRGIHRKFKKSRIILREEGLGGKLRGLMLSTW